MSTRTYDFVALGGGNAGLTAAGRVAAAGRRVAIVDRGAIGGLCSLAGCNPKKVLVRTSEVLDEIRRAAELGIEVGEPRVDWTRLMARKQRFTAPVTAAAERSLAEQGIDLVRGTPRFLGPNTLDVGGTRLEAGAVLIATGSTPRPLDFSGAALVRTTDAVFELDRIPERLVAIGAGVVAFELGQVFARLGTRVTILAPHGRALAGFEPALVDAVLDTSRALGIEIVLDAQVGEVRASGARLLVEYARAGSGRGAEAEFVLNAAGRVPSLDGLALDRAQVGTTARGVVVSPFLRSPSNPAVFAAGDAHGRLQLSPLASHEGRVVARNYLEGDIERLDYDTVPRALYTVPPLAAVGLTEAEARARGHAVTVADHDLATWKVYAIAGAPAARARVILDTRTGRILGAHLFGPEASETVMLFAFAIRFGITADELRRTVFAYPTLASALPHTLP